MEVEQMTDRMQKLREISLGNGVAIASDTEGQKIVAEKQPTQVVEAPIEETEVTPTDVAPTTPIDAKPADTPTTPADEPKLSFEERAEKRRVEREAKAQEEADRKEWEEWKNSEDKKLLEKAKAKGKSVLDLALEYKPIDVAKLSEQELFETLVADNGWDAEKIAEQYELFSEKAEFEKMEILKPVKNALIADNEKKKAELTTPLSSNTQSNTPDPKLVEAMNTFQTELHSKLEGIEGKEEGGLKHTTERVDKIYDFIRENIGLIASEDGGLNAERAVKMARYVLFNDVIEANLLKQGKEEGRVEAQARYTRPSNGADISSSGSPDAPMTAEQKMQASLEYHRQKHGIQTKK